MLPLTLLAPLGLLGLLAIPLIVWFHFRRERRRRIVVPSLLLWQHMPHTPDGRRRRYLPITLLLVLHLLAAALLGLALSQPQWLGELLGSAGHQVVIIDTSTSMAASEAGGTRLDQARDRARGLINNLDSRDRLTLITAGSQAHVLAQGGVENRTYLHAALDTLELQGSQADMPGALMLAQAALDAPGTGRVVVLSDGALPVLSATLADDQPALPALAADVEWVPIGNSLDNRAVVAFASRPRTSGPATDGSETLVYARVANYAAAPLATRVRLIGDDQPLNTRNVNLQANGQAELTWTVPPGVDLLRVEVDGQDALPLDDQASLSLGQGRTINTLLVSADPAMLERALAAVPGTVVRVIDPGQYAGSPLAATADLTIFDSMLPAAWPGGGVLVIHPPAGDSPLMRVEDSLQLSESGRPFPPQIQPSAGADADLFDGLSLESIRFDSARLVDENVTSWATPLVTAGDVPLILRGRVDQTEVAIWTFDLNTSNLSGRLAFPLLVARTVRDLTPQPLPAALTAGSSVTFQPAPRADSVEIRGPDDQIVTLPAGEMVHYEELNQPGLYTFTERSGDDTIYVQQIAVNAGSTLESDLRPQAIPPDLGVARAASPAGADAAPIRRERQPVWPWLALAALAVMIIEWAYVHRSRQLA